MTTDYQGWPADVVERRARAICSGFGNNPDTVDYKGKRQWEEYTTIAVATLEDDDAAGYALVPARCSTEMAVAALKEHGRMVEYGDAPPNEPDWRSCIEEAIAAGARRKEG